MSCRLHPMIATIKDCVICYASWPEAERKKYRRIQCKRVNWRGKVDSNHTNSEDLPSQKLI